jgi:hypothetical protein
MWRVAANVLKKQLRTPTWGDPPAWGLGEVLTACCCKNLTMLRASHKSLGTGPILRCVARSWECGNEASGSIKCGEFRNCLRTSWLLRKDSASWS